MMVGSQVVACGRARGISLPGPGRRQDVWIGSTDMPLGSYDSPTFLGQKDKYMLGLSLPQLMMAVGVIFFWFLVSLAFPYTTQVRLAIMAPLSSVTLALIFVRISGLSIPVYLGLMVFRMFSRPSFEDLGEEMVQGQPEWLEQQRLKAEKEGLRSRFRRGRARAQSLEVESKRVEMQAEVDKTVTETAVGAEQWVREGVRTLIRGG